jgi:hypothetical protein
MTEQATGLSDIRITMRYAHFAPDHMEDAVLFNPLVSIDGGKMSTMRHNG